MAAPSDLPGPSSRVTASYLHEDDRLRPDPKDPFYDDYKRLQFSHPAVFSPSTSVTATETYLDDGAVGVVVCTIRISTAHHDIGGELKRSINLIFRRYGPGPLECRISGEHTLLFIIVFWQQEVESPTGVFSLLLLQPTLLSRRCEHKQ